MKVNNISIKKYKLFGINLLKTQLYKYKKKLTDQNVLLQFTLEDLEVHFKKVFRIIFEYHINNRKIFFVGLPQFKNKRMQKIVKQTNHIFIPNSVWINGFMYNKKVLLRNIIKKQISKKILNLFLSIKIKKNPDLVVVFNPDKETGLIKEFSKLGTPIIVIGDTTRDQNHSIMCNIPVESQFSFKSPRNIFTSLLYSIFKRSLKRSNYCVPRYFFKKRSLHKIKKRIYFFKIKKSRIFINKRRVRQYYRFKSNLSQQSHNKKFQSYNKNNPNRNRKFQNNNRKNYLNKNNNNF